ncbi:hypothetical protein MO973_34205 [Paenibacillus sp. TRM 82003]|uniref:hypothetical protein n=1 Tax=Kineococcus sp. TRM81007 TaxID=2925831 RepID=UPI001F588326|nr:hypothetical protein [Kineococcus sp. TRM81007]MCI2237155.1 hypothetical protein [Kineococcus sp. TRM81007]MCI3925276.1 hypothetical protein [Paenibacillus sp. TRM 82003]
MTGEHVGALTSRALWRDDEPVPLRVGAAGWELLVVGDSLDAITHEGRPVLRAVRFVVRDRDWRTVPADLDPVQVRHHRDGADLTVSARARGTGVDLAWTGHLELRPGRLRFTAGATALAGSLCNRVGIVLLHAPDLAGRELLVHHPDGSTTRQGFPRDVSPHQPARDVAGLEWSVDGAPVRAELGGDVFEVEDQRNWTDASFKTYSTPLEHPFPVLLPAGHQVHQELVLERPRPSAGYPAVPAVSDAPVPELELVPSSAVVPEFLVGASTAPSGEARRPAFPWMRSVGVLVELDLGSAGWRTALDRARQDADGTALDVRLVTDDPGSLRAAVDALEGVPMRRIGAFSATTHVGEPALLEELTRLTAGGGAPVEVVAGTRAHFTELNRNHERLPPGAASLTFSTTPQMHETGRTQVVESLAVQRLVAEQAVRLAAGRPVHVGPVTLRPRFNAVATSPRPVDTAPDVTGGYAAQHVPGATDPRQRSEAYAAWLVASAAALAVPGVSSLCFAEAWGPRGFGEADGTPFPAAAALQRLAVLSGQRLWRCRAQGVPGTAVLAADADGVLTVLAANATDAPQRLRLALPAGSGPGLLEQVGHHQEPVPTPGGGPLDLDVAPGRVVVWTGRRPGELR